MSSTVEMVWLVNLVLSGYLLGLIVTIQWVHYPLFAFADPARNSAFHDAHQRRITQIVGLPMVMELVAAFALVWLIPSALTLTAAALVCAIWLSTLLLQVPQHSKLMLSFDAQTHRRLVSTNWVRTVCWLGRVAILIVMFVQT